jgi:hypothetical protein
MLDQVNLVNLANLSILSSVTIQNGGNDTSESDRNPHNILPYLDEDNIKIKNKSLCIRKSSIQDSGLGVYTNRDFNIEDIVEIAPVIRVQTEYLFQENNILNDYIFRDPYDNNYKIVALGFGSMYNHADEPNMKYYYQNGKMIYQAIKPIKAGDELFISYGVNWWIARTNKKRNND